MGTSSPYLTKSRFKLALECPTKLYYARNTDTYRDRNEGNDFLQTLADSGYQVGELAKFKYHEDPIGSKITIDTLNPELALRETEERLKSKGRKVIAEAALRDGNYFVRVDILIHDSTNKTVELIEVKSKSVDAETVKKNFKNKNGYAPEWKPYLYDIAFQAEVARRTFPGFLIKPKLLLVNSEGVCDMDGLHQNFKIVPEQAPNGTWKTKVMVPDGLKKHNLKGFDALLKEVDVAHIVEDLRTSPIVNEPHIPLDKSCDLGTFMDWVAGLYASETQHFGGVSKACKSCQFRADANDEKRSGLHECWEKAIQNNQLIGERNPIDRNKPLSIDIWGGGFGKVSVAEKVILKKRAFLSDVQSDDIAPKEKKVSGTSMTPFERRMAQVEAVQTEGKNLRLEETRLNDMDRWVWPLHMIDFETSAPAIPFFKGMHPGQTLAFQFSHHLMEKDDTGKVSIRHANQWISTEAGKYPSIDFVRALRDALMPHGELMGKVFRYHNHENAVLRKVRYEIEEQRSLIPDADQLIEFIKLITKPSDKELFQDSPGEKVMVDLHRLVQEGYYSSKAGGSISLKYILPAILSDSPRTAELYSRPGIYGSGLMINSLNFTEPGGHIWLQPEKDNDPYKTLPKVFGERDNDLDEMLSRLVIYDEDDEGGSINKGGLAMTAYNYTQFTTISTNQRMSIQSALLKYCELDTLAMVIIVQGLMELRGKSLVLK